MKKPQSEITVKIIPYAVKKVGSEKEYNNVRYRVQRKVPIIGPFYCWKTYRSNRSSFEHPYVQGVYYSDNPASFDTISEAMSYARKFAQYDMDKWKDFIKQKEANDKLKPHITTFKVE